MKQSDDQKSRLILITGIMAAGKSTVAQKLAEQFSKSVHLRGDIFRRMIVCGQAEMTTELSSEAHLQLSLRYKIAVQAAAAYFEAGFTVIYQDIILGNDLQQVVEDLSQYPLHLVVLCPSAETVAKRESERNKTGYGDLPVGAFDEALRRHTPRLGLWLDTSQQTVMETVNAILGKLSQARVTPI